MIKQIINWLKKKETLFSVDFETIENALPKINYKILNHARYYYMDRDYESCSLGSFRNILQKDFTNWKIYHKDYDCDDFAFKLYTNLKARYPRLAIGVIISDSHAFNFFIDKYGKVWYIEPQTDKIYTYKQLKKQYKPFVLSIL